MLLITGASGRIARLTAELLAPRRIPLRLMSRTPERARHIAGADIVRGDFAEPASLDAAFAGIDVALVVSGSARPGARALQHRNAFQAAARSHVRHLIYLSLQGAGPHSRFAYSRDHYESEQFLAGSGLPAFTILRIGFYMDMLVQFAAADGVVHDPVGEGRAAFISREDTARCAAAVIAHPPGGVHEVTGPELLSVAEAVRRLSVLTEGHIRYAHEPSGAPREDAAAPATADWRHTLYAGWFGAIAAGELARIGNAVAEFTGTDPMTLEGYFTAFPEALHPPGAR